MKLRSHNARLDQFTLDIEFLLISVIQGLALSVLAASSIGPISNLDLQYWLYVVSAFLILFIFWSEAIIHALSFIDWPLDLTHTFLYFLASFLQVLSYSKVTDPLHWFSFMTVFFGVAIVLYRADYGLIKNRKKDFEVSEEGRALYAHIEKQHLFEMKVLVPLGFVFNLVAAWMIWKMPAIMIGQGYHIWLVGVQVLFLLVVLANAIGSFKKRSLLIEKVSS